MDWRPKQGCWRSIIATRSAPTGSGLDVENAVGVSRRHRSLLHQGSFVRCAEYQGNGAVIAGVLGTKTPQHGTAVAIKIHRLVALGIMATTAGTHRLAAAIVIRHQVVTVICGITAGTHPGNR